MIPVLLLFFAAAPDRTPVIGETLAVPANDWRAIDLTLQQRPAVVDCKFTVVKGKSPVSLELVPRDELESLQAQEPHHVLVATNPERSGRLRFRPPKLGDYALVVNNAHSSRAVEVELNVSLDFGAAAELPVRTLSSGRRAVIVFVTLTLFGLVVFYAGRQVIRASSRSRPG